MPLFTSQVDEPLHKFFIYLEFFDPTNGMVFSHSFPNGGKVNPEDKECKEREPVPNNWDDMMALVDAFMARWPHLQVTAVKEVTEAIRGQNNNMPWVQWQIKGQLEQRFGCADSYIQPAAIPQLVPGQQNLNPQLQQLMQQHGLAPAMNPMQEAAMMRPPSPEMARSESAQHLLAQLKQMGPAAMPTG